jgi:hypothetical protein
VDARSWQTDAQSFRAPAAPRTTIRGGHHARRIEDVHHHRRRGRRRRPPRRHHLAAGPKHNVRYLNYWFDAATGTVMCLSEAPSAEAAVAVHREAHGLVPTSIEEVSEGR